MSLFLDVPLLQRSLELFRELDDYYVSELRGIPDHEGGIGRLDRLLEMSGAVMVGTPDSEVVSGVLRSIKEHKLPHKVYSAAQMRKLYPTFHLSEDEVAVHEDSAGYLMAELCVESYIALARKHGAELHFEEPMLDWKPCMFPVAADHSGVHGDSALHEEEGVEVRTARGVYRAKKLVLSVGAWAPSIYGDQIPHVPLFIERRVLFWFQCDEDKIADFNVSVRVFPPHQLAKLRTVTFSCRKLLFPDDAGVYLGFEWPWKLLRLPGGTNTARTGSIFPLVLISS